MDLLQTLDALLNDIAAEARKAEAEAKENGERITSKEAHKRAIDRMSGKENQ